MTGSPFGPAGLSHGGAFQVGSLPAAHAISGGEWARAILNARIVHAGKEVHRAPVNPCPGCRNSIRTYAMEMAISFATGRGIVNQIRDAMNTVVGSRVRAGVLASPVFTSRCTRKTVKSTAAP